MSSTVRIRHTVSWISGDIRDSIAAGARPVRVQRARNSVDEDPTHDGAFGEALLVGSES